MHQALYRKYRPKSFDDVVSQDFVVNTLKNSIKNKKISHAYMFFGPRGIGKTTIAKIFSRSINCLDSIDGNPCEKCENCLKSTQSVDIIEIDAASNNGVDEIREIKSKVNIVPSELKYKVYIIDEVHMLTPGAFNALLKTLEEPPKHVVFILATTDPQKVSDTIISRCQCYSFTRIKENANIKKLTEVCEKEKIDIDDEVLKLIAQYSEGGLRDSLGVLDKLSSYKNVKITLDDFYEINDMISEDELKKFKNSILDLNSSEIIEKINAYNSSGKNLVEIISQMIKLLRNEIVSYYIDGANISYDINKLISLINLLNEKMFDIKKSGNPCIYIEIVLLNYVNQNKIISQEIILEEKKEVNENSFLENKNKIKKIDDYEHEEKVVEQKKNNNSKKSLVNFSNIKEIIKVRVNNVLATANKEIRKIEENNMNKLNDFIFDQEFGYIVSELLNSKLRAANENVIILSYEYDSVVEQNINNILKIEEIYNKILKNDKKIAIISDLEWENYIKEYKNNIKKNIKYDIIKEPELIMVNSSEEYEFDEESNDALDLFKEIVEFN